MNGWQPTYFDVPRLRDRGWTITMIGHFLGGPDCWGPVNHYLNRRGKRLYRVERVQMEEASDEFVEYFKASARRRRLKDTFVAETLARISRLREDPPWLKKEQPGPEEPSFEEVIRNCAAMLSGIRAAGDRTPHKCP